MSASVFRHGEIHHRNVYQKEQEKLLCLLYFVVIVLTTLYPVKT